MEKSGGSLSETWQRVFVSVKSVNFAILCLFFLPLFLFFFTFSLPYTFSFSFIIHFVLFIIFFVSSYSPSFSHTFSLRLTIFILAFVLFHTFLAITLFDSTLFLCLPYRIRSDGGKQSQTDGIIHNNLYKNYIGFLSMYVNEKPVPSECITTW